MLALSRFITRRPLAILITILALTIFFRARRPPSDDDDQHPRLFSRGPPPKSRLTTPSPTPSAAQNT